MPYMPEPLVRTLVVMEVGNKRHVFELDAEATETYENPLFNDPHRLGPRRLEVEGAVLRHVVYDRMPGDDLLSEQTGVEAPHPAIEGER